MKKALLILSLLAVALAGCRKQELRDADDATHEVAKEYALKEARKAAHVDRATQDAQNAVDRLVFVRHKKTGLCFAYSSGNESITQVDCKVMEIMTGTQ